MDRKGISPGLAAASERSRTGRGAALLLGWIALAGTTSPDPASPNRIYEKLRDGMATLDVSMLQSAYGPGAVYLPHHPTLPLHRHDEIMDGMTRSVAMLRDQAARVDSRFRVVERHRIGDAFLDVGYGRTSIERPGANAETRTTKFMVLLRRQPDAAWAIAFDSESGAPASAYDNARPVEGLHYDRLSGFPAAPG